MQTRFHASQSIELVVPQQPIPIEHYLRQPQRLIKALVDPSRVELLSSDTFRLKMRSLNFMMLTIQPTVDLKLTLDADGAIHLQSVGSEIRGVEYINNRFHLDLKGCLAPRQTNGHTIVQGEANLVVSVDVPPALWLTPKPLLEATGNGLLRSVLATIKQRLTHQLLADYQNWLADHAQSECDSLRSRSSSVLTPQG
ncbi:DUF1997 domain-containing protein [Leptolyngbya sp. AN02str]|uniref:DUF1997 domain-containing protein n=1 Tax=Leptolyngbya sp. AN02str TaxID=3423363 RepID=UPI003D315238